MSVNRLPPVGRIRAVHLPQGGPRVPKSLTIEYSDRSNASKWYQLERLDPVWDELFPAEQARIVQLLVARVDVAVDGIEVHLRTNGLTSTYRHLAAIALPQEAAA